MTHNSFLPFSSFIPSVLPFYHPAFFFSISPMLSLHLSLFEFSNLILLITLIEWYYDVTLCYFQHCIKAPDLNLIVFAASLHTEQRITAWQAINICKPTVWCLMLANLAKTVNQMLALLTSVQCDQHLSWQCFLQPCLRGLPWCAMVFLPLIIICNDNIIKTWVFHKWQLPQLEASTSL